MDHLVQAEGRLRRNGSRTRGPRRGCIRRAGTVTVYDVKTGAQRDSDVAQVMIYMYALPLAANSLWKGMSLDGRVVYKDGTEGSHSGNRC